MKNFEGFGLSQELNKSLSKMDHKTPTPIQAKAIPLALQGRDVLGSAQTGTGKTAAFSIPLVESLLRNPRGIALVLTPTRELAKQVLDVIHQLVGYKSPIKTAFIIGGESMGKQLSQLRAQPRIIVGTPGRINDHLERGTLKLHDAGFLVLDETDRMLDMGFGVQIDRILKFMPKKRQTLMFSATMPNEIIKLSSKYLTNPERVSMGATNVVALNIKQDVIRIEQDKKYKELVLQLHDRSGSVIIFVKTKHGTERMAKNLRRDGFEADALHGDLRQNKRNTVMNNFRRKKFRILVATDVAARGLDVPHIEHVINYDLPQVAEDYIHRMGRTARAGAKGSALSFVSSQEGRKWHAIEQLLDPSKKAQAPQGARRVPGAYGKKKPFSGKPGGYVGRRKQRSHRRSEGGRSEGGSSEGRPEAGKARGQENRKAKGQGDRQENRNEGGQKSGQNNGEKRHRQDGNAQKPTSRYIKAKPHAKKHRGKKNPRRAA
ncbi:MAG: DEAD/DEAH box helicase [Micavibrio sp.]|nr:MAG: DEAD/DEAH box helicase [Micavibrio sp.]